MTDANIIDLDTSFGAISMPGTGTQHASRVEQLRRAVSARIDALCGPVVAREITKAFRPTSGLVILDDWVSWGQFPNAEVQAVSELTEYVSGVGGALTGETLDAEGGYLVVDGILERRSSFYRSTWQGPIVVTYTAGRFASVDVVDALFVEAASEILERIWQQYAPAWSRGGIDPTAVEGGFGFFRSVDPVIEELLAYERRPPAIA